MFRSMLVAVAALSVVGCAAQNITATPGGITMKYNSAVTDFLDVVFQANQHCSQYAKVASLTDTTISPTATWSTHTRSFRCE